MTDLEIQALRLFELSPSSPKYLWMIASDWLEEHGLDDITLQIFIKQIDLVNLSDRFLPEMVEFSLDGLRSSQLGCGRSCGFGGNTFSNTRGEVWNECRGNGAAGSDCADKFSESRHVNLYLGKDINIQITTLYPMHGNFDEI